MLRRTPLLFFVLLFAASLIPAAHAQDAPQTIPTRRVQLADALANGAIVGRLRVRGMLELQALDINDARLSQLSALAWDDDDGILYALSDKGRLFHLVPQFTDGNLSGITVQKALALTDPKTGKRLRSWLNDAEGMDILNGRNGRKGDAELLISFEHTPRIMRYRPDGTVLEQLTLPTALADAKAYQHPNKMLESVCHDPALGALTTPEEPLENEQEGSTRLFSLAGKVWRYPLNGSHRITAIECLGARRLLVLERDFGLTRNAVALKQLTLPDNPPSTPLTPEIVVTLNAQDGYQIDNFEGMTRHKGNMFFIISDDNDLFIQRTLLLYFELLPQ